MINRQIDAIFVTVNQSTRIMPRLVATLAAIAGALLSSDATAQTNGPGTINPVPPAATRTAPVISDISASELIAVFEERAQFTGKIVSTPGTQPVIVELASPSGGTTYGGLANCTADAGGNMRCAMVEMFAYFDASGITLSTLNDFNLNTSYIATAGVSREGVGYFANKNYINGGVTSENLFNRIGLYLLDVDRLVAALQAGLGTQVNVAGDAPASAASPANGHSARYLARDAQGSVARFGTSGYIINAAGQGAGIFTTPALRAKISNGSFSRHR